VRCGILVFLASALVASGIDVTDCFCVDCDHAPKPSCSTCDAPSTPERKSCCGQEQPAQPKPHKECTHSQPTLKAPVPAHDAPAAPVAIESAPAIPPALVPCFDIARAERLPPAKRKAFLLNAALLL
jgi:hypothetical protein